MHLESNPLERYHSNCELCSSNSELAIYNIPSIAEINTEKSIMLCNTCLKEIKESNLI